MNNSQSSFEALMCKEPNLQGALKPSVPKDITKIITFRYEQQKKKHLCKLKQRFPHSITNFGKYSAIGKDKDFPL
jgi:hypothetical protein